MKKKRRKNKPGQGRKAEGRVKMTVHVLPLTAQRINFLVDKKQREINTQGKIIDRQFGVQAAEKVAGARRKALRGEHERGAKKHSGAKGASGGTHAQNPAR